MENPIRKPIYFTKIEFTEYTRFEIVSTLLLNLPQRELSYQTYAYQRQIPAIQGHFHEKYYLGSKEAFYKEEMQLPGKRIRNAETQFKPVLFPDDQYDMGVASSYGITLSEDDIRALLPYCNALDFEPYRDRVMSWNDEGRIGYRDEVKLKFRGVTGDSIPLIELPMDYYYDEKHIWPSEKLYRYLVRKYFKDNQKIKGPKPWYESASLPL